MKKIFIFCLAAVVLLSLSACGASGGGESSEAPEIEVTTEEPEGVITISEGRIYNDTEEPTHTCYLSMLGETDATQPMDGVHVSKENPGFWFECHGVSTESKLYVFVDGDIDDVAGEFDVDNEIYSDKIMLDERELKEGEHVVQFVQFDGPDIIYCVTRHYISG